MSYLSHAKAIATIAEDLSLQAKRMLVFTEDKEEIVSSFFVALGEACYVSRLLESDYTVTMSQALYFLHEL